MDIKFVIKIARTFLGLVLIIFGINFFVDFLGIIFPAGEAADFMQTLNKTGYFIPMLATTQIVLGFLLAANIFVPFTLIVLIPLNLNILLFNLFVSPVNISLSIVMFVSHVFLLILYKDKFYCLFKIEKE